MSERITMNHSIFGQRSWLLPKVAGSVALLLVALGALGTQAIAHPPLAAPQPLHTLANGFTVGQSAYHDVSPPLRTLAAHPGTARPARPKHAPTNLLHPSHNKGGPDQVIQQAPAPAAMPTP